MKDSKKKGSPNQLSLWEDFHAKTYPLQEKEKELSKENDQVFGRNLRGSSKMYSQRGQLLKMYRPFDLKDLPWSYKISMRSGTMLSGIVYPVPQLVGYTEEIAYGSSQDRDMWATPNSMDHLPPRSKEAMERQFATTRKGRTKPSNLREQVHPDMWPTPQAQDAKHSTTNWKPRKDSNRQMQLVHKVGEIEATYKLWSTKEQKQIEKKPGQLNPTWVEWLMGYPEDYTLIEDEEE